MAVINGKTGERTYEGCVFTVAWESQYTYDPISTLVAQVWDEPTGTVKRVVLGGDYCATTWDKAEVDATPEVRMAAAVAALPALMAQVHAEDRSVWREEVLEAHDVETKGGRVRVTKGRNIVKGTEGTVFWAGEDRYAPSWQHRARRVGFITDDGTRLYTAATNLVAIDRDPPLWSEYESTEEEAYEQAWPVAARKYGVIK